VLVSLIPPPPSRPVPVEAVALDAKKRNRSVSLIQAPAGTGIRTHGSATDTLFYFSVPGSGAWLLLAFSGPDGPLASAMADLFDAIAGTLRWSVIEPGIPLARGIK